MNLVILLGNLGKDPTVRYSQGGTAFCSFSIATSDQVKDKKELELYTTITEWHHILCVGKTAELCHKYLSKGRQVLVEGSVHYSSWDGKDGKKQYKTEIKAHRVKFLGQKNDEVAAKGPDNVQTEMFDIKTDPQFETDEIPF